MKATYSNLRKYLNGEDKAKYEEARAALFSLPSEKIVGLLLEDTLVRRREHQRKFGVWLVPRLFILMGIVLLLIGAFLLLAALHITPDGCSGDFGFAGVFDGCPQMELTSELYRVCLLALQQKTETTDIGPVTEAIEREPGCFVSMAPSATSAQKCEAGR